uniref:Uncharacterized protein n=1 Tax=Cacopsylla melanoneura TaxID=428564 RepID=A0A8D8X288_9HEMI
MIIYRSILINQNIIEIQLLYIDIAANDANIGHVRFDSFFTHFHLYWLREHHTHITCFPMFVNQGHHIAHDQIPAFVSGLEINRTVLDVYGTFAQSHAYLYALPDGSQSFVLLVNRSHHAHLIVKIVYTRCGEY